MYDENWISLVWNVLLIDLCGAGNIFCVVCQGEDRLLSHAYHLNKGGGGETRFENEDINEWLAQHSSGVTPVCVEHHQRFLRCNWAAERTQTLVVFTAQTLKHPCDGYSVCVPEEQLRFAATLVDFRRWCFSFRGRDLSKQTGVYCSCFLHQTFYKLQQLPVASPWNFVIIRNHLFLQNRMLVWRPCWKITSRLQTKTTLQPWYRRLTMFVILHPELALRNGPSQFH